MTVFGFMNQSDREDERRWNELCAEIKVYGPLPVRMRVRNGTIEVEIMTRDRDTDVTMRVRMNVPLWTRWLNRESGIRILWDAYRQAWLHEAAEFFVVGGERVMDPHKAGEPR